MTLLIVLFVLAVTGILSWHTIAIMIVIVLANDVLNYHRSGK